MRVVYYPLLYVAALAFVYAACKTAGTDWSVVYAVCVSVLAFGLLRRSA